MDFLFAASSFHGMIKLSNISPLSTLTLEDALATAYMQIRLKYGQTVFEVNRVIGGREAAERGRAGKTRLGQRSKRAALCAEYQWVCIMPNTECAFALGPGFIFCRANKST